MFTPDLFVQYLADLLDSPLWKVISSTIATAAVIAAVTPTPADDTAVKWARWGLDLLAFNFGHAKNAKK